MSRVPGHTLAFEGRPYEQDGRESRDGTGGGKCTCGVVGEPLASGKARQRWHWQHKVDVLNAQETGESR